MINLISITGPIAAGATTLASKLSADFSWYPLFEEDVEADSPYFSLFHKEPSKFALHNQLVFLSRSAAKHLGLRNGPQGYYVQDFTPFEHNEVYSRVLYEEGCLDENERELLNRVATVFNSLFVVPRILIYRPLNDGLLLQRVRSRNRPSEQKLELEYLRRVSSCFDKWISTWTRSPVVFVDPNLDIINDQVGYKRLVQNLEVFIGQY